MSHRFRFIGEKDAGALWQLVGEEAHHLAKVLRLEEGAAVEVTDARGVWALGTVVRIGAKAVAIEATDEFREAAPDVRLAFAIGALKPGAVDDILPALTELGVDTVHVFLQKESAKSRLTDKVAERWQRILVQALKQCKRARLPAIVEHGSLAALLHETAGDAETRRYMLAAGAARPLGELLRQGGPGRGVLLVAGGEKGLIPDEEAALFEAGFCAASLGPHVLRAVTAAVAAVAVATDWRESLAAPPPKPS